MKQRYDTYKDSGVQWLGEIPGHWGCVRLKHTGSSRNGLTYSPGDEVHVGEGILVLRSSNIQGGKLCFNDNVYVNKQIEESLYMKKDDILICSRNGSRDLVGKLVRIDENMECTFGAFMMVYRTTKWAPFMAYSLQVVISSYKSLFSTSTINQLVKSKFDNFYTPIPPLSEQHAIVSYLDDKCGKIDEWLDKKQKEVELLGEMKQRVIADAVTRGLNPNVKMKATNNICLGDVPEHWQVMRYGTLFKLKPVKQHHGEELLSVFLNLGVIRAADSDKRTHAASEDLSKYQLVEPTDFVMNNQQAWRGSVGVSKLTGIISPAYHVFIMPTCFDADYANALLRSKAIVGQFEMSSRGVGSIQRTLNFNWLNNRLVPVPPLDEQKQIIDYITDKTSKIDKLIVNINKEIEGIKEYKQRLISDVVTGQIKVC